MVVKNYAALKADGTTWPEGATDDANRKTQRNVIIGEQWTKAEDDDPSRYISFGLTWRIGKMELEQKARQGATDLKN